MSVQPPNPQRRVDRDGVTRVATGGGGRSWLLAIAILIACACLAGAVWVVLSARSAVRGAAPDRMTSRGDAPPLRPDEPRRTWVTATPAAPRAAQVDEDHPDEDPVLPELLVDPAEAPPPVTGGRSGIDVFPPRGTKPLRRGIVVPEGFELPPGYLRHYQTTDDGQQLQPILMFHPDHKPVDAQGRPIPIPENRVVPPEMAPPGIPLQMLDLPKDKGAEKPR